MPIRLNLLAEQQLIEEMRRRDPVKRGYLAAGVLLGLVILYSVNLFLMNLLAESDLKRRDTIWLSLTNTTQTISNDVQTIRNISNQLEELKLLAANRFLWGPFLNTLQYSIVDEVQITRFTTKQEFQIRPAVKPTAKEKEAGKKPIPAASAEQNTITIEAKSFGIATQEKIDNFIRNLRSQEYLKTIFTNDASVVLKSFSQPQPDLIDTNKSYVAFTLECKVPERVR